VELSSPSSHHSTTRAEKIQSLPETDTITVKEAIQNGLFENALLELIREGKKAAQGADAEEKFRKTLEGWRCLD
jgi:hypothetical protein